MGTETARFFDLLRAVRNWVAQNVGISGLGTNPTNLWCQHPGRPPLQEGIKAPPATTNPAVDLVHHCFVCGLELSHEIQGEENS